VIGPTVLRAPTAATLLCLNAQEVIAHLPNFLDPLLGEAVGSGLTSLTRGKASPCGDSSKLVIEPC